MTQMQMQIPAVHPQSLGVAIENEAAVGSTTVAAGFGGVACQSSLTVTFQECTESAGAMVAPP